MLRREDEGERRSYAEPTGEIAGARRRRRRIQDMAYWGSLLLLTGLLALFLAATLPERGRAEEAERDTIATVSARKTEVASATAAAATASSVPVSVP